MDKNAPKKIQQTQKKLYLGHYHKVPITIHSEELNQVIYSASRKYSQQFMFSTFYVAALLQTV